MKKFLHKIVQRTCGRDTLDGGTGNDYLNGGAGNDTYLFNLGGGQDTIYESDWTAGNLDSIQFGNGIAASDITITHGGMGLVLGINGTTDQIKIQNWGYGENFHIEQIKFDDGSSWDASQIQARIPAGCDITGTDNNDYLSAWVGENSILMGLAGADNLNGNTGNDTLDGGTGNDDLIGGYGNDTYLFNLGDGQDTINDYDSTWGDVDTIQFGTGIVASNITVLRSGMDLLLSINGTTDQIRIQNWGNSTYYRIEQIKFADGSSWDAAQIQAQIPAGGDITGTDNNDYLSAWVGENSALYGLGGADTLSGNSGNDTLDGGTGNDYLQGGAGNDTYLFNPGGGQDAIYDYAGTDTIQFGAGIVASDITCSLARSGVDLVLKINGTSDQLTLQYWGYGYPYGIERVEFADGLVWYATDLKAQAFASLIVGTNGNDYLYGNEWNNTLDGGVGNDTMSGFAGNDTYLFNLGGGQDTIYDHSYADGTDTIQFGAGIAASDITFTRSGMDLLLKISGTTDQLTIQYWGTNNYYRIEHVKFADGTVWNATQLQALLSALPTIGTEGVDSLQAWAGENANLQGLGGDDYLSGDVGNDTLNGGIGNDDLIGGYGNDTYLFNLGDGQDTIIDWDTTAGNVDNIQFGAGIAASDMTFTRSGMDLVLSITGTSDQLTIQGWGNGVDYHIERIEFADGSSWDATQIQSFIPAASDFVGTDGVDALCVWSGENATLQGMGGDDSLSGNDGNDTLDGGAGSDWLVGRAGDDSYVVDDYGDIVIEEFNQGIDNVQSSISITLSANVENLTLTGTTAINGTGNELDNVLIGNSAKNTLTGNAGNDTLDGGAGVDTMLGGTGDDIYIVDSTRDTVTENLNEGIDTVQSSVSYTLATNVENLTLTGIAAINGTGNDLDNLLTGNSADNTLSGAAGNDILQGGAGNDALKDSAGNNLFDGGAGVDTLTGAGGKELFIGGTDNDTITTGAGADIIAFNKGDGQDTVVASTGTDNTISLGGGIKYVNLTMSKSLNNLVLNTGNGEQIILQNWYKGTSNHSVKNLQVVLDSSTYNAASSDTLLNQQVQTFDFATLVSNFDQAQAANPTLTAWSMTDALLTAHLSGSDTAALGGDLAYQYNLNNSLAGIGLASAQTVMNDANFGTAPQMLKSLPELQTGAVRLG